MHRLLILVASILMSGCATVQQMEPLDKYKACAVADVVTTTVGLTTNLMHETNPLTRALFVKSFGAVGGYVVPVVALSIAGYYLLKWINQPALTTTVAGVTCFSAARNLWIIR